MERNHAHETQRRLLPQKSASRITVVLALPATSRSSYQVRCCETTSKAFTPKSVPSTTPAAKRSTVNWPGISRPVRTRIVIVPTLSLRRNRTPVIRAAGLATGCPAIYRQTGSREDRICGRRRRQGRKTGGYAAAARSLTPRRTASRFSDGAAKMVRYA